ncbi:MAG TPA: hypothetical protein VGE52_10505, partial [Pirellulales bacterium]
MLRFSKHRGAFLFVLAAGLWSGPFVPVAQAQSLSPEHVELLQQLSPETAAQATKLLATAAQWRQRWQQINERLNAANLEDEAQLAAQAAGAEALQQLTTAVEAEIQKLAAPVREKLGPVLAALEEARAAWREAEQTAKTVEFIAEQNVGLTEAQFREKARRKALALAAHRVSPLVEQRVIVVVEALKNPVDYAQNFMQGEFDSWLREPREIAGEDGFKLKVVAPPQGVSVFSPNANLGVEIEYLPGSFNVKATGLYFEYRPGAAPRPVIDKLNVDASSGLLNQSVDKLKQFGNEILADMDLPVKITVTSLPDFTGARGPKGALTCTVELGLLGGKAKGKAEGIQLSPGNKVDWKGAVVTVEAPAKPPIPLGTTPFAIWKLIGSYGPSEKIFGFGAQISTAATPSEVIALDVRAKTSMPVKQIAIEGSLLVLT